MLKLMQQWKSENKREKGSLKSKAKGVEKMKDESPFHSISFNSNCFFWTYIYYKHLQEVMTLKASHLSIHDSKIKNPAYQN